MSASVGTIDFHAFHRDELPARLAGGNGALAGPAGRRLGSLAFRTPAGDAYTYVPGDAGVAVVPGDETADTVIEVEPEIFSNLVNELDAAAGLLYGGRARCRKGNAIRWVDWEPALRAMYHGRPVYDPATLDLRDRHGDPLDPGCAFTLADDRDDMAWFLRTAGYLLVRDVFRPDEIDRFLAEAAELAAEAVPGDGLSWWGKGPNGEDTLCRVTRAGARPQLASIPSDPRLLELVALADEPLAHQSKGSNAESVSLIWKRPGMTEGLGDLPWHRDCGMGGHAILCPLLIASVFLTPANEDTGELRFLPGSWNRGCGPIDARHPKAPRGVSVAAAPGDVSLHCGDTMHAAPPPTRTDLARYRISAVTAYAQAGARPHRGRYYNEVLHRREDGQIEHLSKIAENT
jgi:hypothetical protein